LSSHFQPIISVADQCVIGHEGLLRAHDRSGHSLPPAAVFDFARSESGRVTLDWLSRALHMRNVRNFGADSGLLFINVAPDAATKDPQFREVFSTLIDHCGVNPERIVVEITESVVADEPKLVDAVALYRSLGCLVAIDDFGSGASDVARISRLKPNIVKLDRSMLSAAAGDDLAMRVLRNVVNMMHDCGAQVVLEGVEDRVHAEAAIETSADFLQGYYFGLPNTERLPNASVQRLLANLLPGDEIVSVGSDVAEAPGASDWHRHAEALAATAMAIYTGDSFPKAVQLLQSLPGTVRCCLLSSDGKLLGNSVDPHRQVQPALGIALNHIGWRTKRLATRAADDPGVVKLTMSKISPIAFATCRFALTLCYGIRCDAQTKVLCVDVVC
jgi:EAL domain-containing protein (putative c-di-GMP-specific phosphodiesterase class I)